MRERSTLLETQEAAFLSNAQDSTLDPRQVTECNGCRPAPLGNGLEMLGNIKLTLATQGSRAVSEFVRENTIVDALSFVSVHGKAANALIFSRYGTKTVRDVKLNDRYVPIPLKHSTLEASKRSHFRCPIDC